jgi:RHS repeat-associated protein
MRIRTAQLDRLGADKLDAFRRKQLLALREQGLDVQEHDKDSFRIMDAAGGSVDVTSSGLASSLCTGERRRFHLEQYWHGRIKRIVDPLGTRVSFARTSTGLLTAIEAGDKRCYGFSHDPAGRLLAIDYPDGTSTRSEFNDAGQLTTVWDRNGYAVRFQYSADRLLEKFVDARLSETRFTYGGWDLPSRIDYADGSKREFDFDDRGRLARMRVNGNEYASFFIDELGGRHGIEYADGTRVRYQISDGRLVEAANDGCSVRLEYDAQGRLVAEHTSKGVVRFGRNAVGAVTSLALPTGEQLAFVRDTDQRLMAMTDWNGNRIAFESSAAGPPPRVRFPNGVVETWNVTTEGLLAGISLHDAAGQVLDSRRWNYDACQRLVSEQRSDGHVRYRYDNEGRLITVEAGDPSSWERFERDAKGNVVRHGSIEATYDSNDRIEQRDGVTFVHDAMGNLARADGAQGAVTYAYNGGGQLVGAKCCGVSTRYAYDALGRRILKQTPGTTTEYLWAGSSLVAETTTVGSTTTRREYLWDPDRPIPYAMRVNGDTYYLHVGNRCEVLCMTDSAGAVVWRANYDALGKAQIEVNRVAQPWRLAGQYFDEETELHYNVARYYDPRLGRYITVDPVTNGLAKNDYVYCDGDPINRIDPLGTIGAFLTGVLIGAAVGAAIGAAIGVGIEVYREHQQGQGYDGWKIAKAGLIGGVIGAIGGAVGAAVEGAALAAMGIGAIIESGAVGAMSIMAAGALAGEVSAGVEYCAEVAFTDATWNSAEFGKAILVGGAVGAVTAGVGGWIASKLARRAARKSLQEGAETAAAAERKAAKAATETVDVFHGSKDTSKFPNGKLDPEYDGAFYTAKDPAVANDAIKHHSSFDQAPNPGILKSSIPKEEFDALVQSGDIKIRKYKGFEGNLDTEEIMFVTPKAKETFNKYLSN